MSRKKIRRIPVIDQLLDARLVKRTRERETHTVTRKNQWTGNSFADVEKEVVLQKLSLKEPLLIGSHDRSASPVTELVIVREDGTETLAGTRISFGKEHTFQIGWWPHSKIETCPGCGQTVIWTLRQGRWWSTTDPSPCSERCRARMRRGEVDRTRECEWCGEKFSPARSHAKTCSTRCRVALHRSRNASGPGGPSGPESVTRNRSRPASGSGPESVTEEK